jgi:hypothetical protein
MKQRQYITTFSLIAALTGLSPVVVADAERTSDGERIQPAPGLFERPLGYKLSPEQTGQARNIALQNIIIGDH